MKIANLLIGSMCLNYCDGFKKFMPFNSYFVSDKDFSINDQNILHTDSVQVSYISELENVNNYVSFKNIEEVNIADLKYDQIKNSIDPDDVINLVNIDIIQNKINEKLFILNENSVVSELATNKKIGRFIVNSISSLLPKVDSIGHNVLHANNVFISDILGSEIIPENLKRDIILSSIKLAICGDNFGSHLLEFYYNIVDACL